MMQLGFDDHPFVGARSSDKSGRSAAIGRCRAVSIRMIDMPIPPIPRPTGFPVYGLSDTFAGFQWVVLWDGPRGLTSVILGHGPRKVGGFVAVETFRKTPRQDFADGSYSFARGFGHAASTAQGNMPDPAGQETESARDTFAPIHSDADTGHADLIDWDHLDISIGEQTYPAAVQRTDSGWAMAIDLPDLAIAA
jgi:hypothetical protein